MKKGANAPFFCYTALLTDLFVTSEITILVSQISLNEPFLMHIVVPPWKFKAPYFQIKFL
ncbi:hypothetical protein PBAL39_24910 [Pedobacter sp. BAL39]|nr:hypothetical protein PBAL39_24910 [Pedobacter sp. BAL39]